MEKLKKLHTFSLWERPLAGLLKEILAKEGIACLVRNENLFAAMGEIPLIECYPELWVIDDETLPRAKLLLDGWLKNSSLDATPWVCPDCHERLDGHFGACWSCGRQRE